MYCLSNDIWHNIFGAKHYKFITVFQDKQEDQRFVLGTGHKVSNLDDPSPIYFNNLQTKEKLLGKKYKLITKGALEITCEVKANHS